MFVLITYKIYKYGKKSYYLVIRVEGNKLDLQKENGWHLTYLAPVKKSEHL